MRATWMAAVTAMALLLTACGEGDQPQVPRQADQDGTTTTGTGGSSDVTITMWHWETPPHRVDVTEEVAQRFKEETGITLQQVPINFPDYQQRMLAAIRSGELPDMIQVNPPTFMTLIAHDAIVPVTDVFESIHGEVEFFEPAYGPYEYEGEHWGIPVFGVLWPLLYRGDLYDSIDMSNGPETWDDLLTASEQLHAPDANRYGFGLPISTNGNYGSQVAWGFLASNGGAIVDCTDGSEKIVFDSPETVEAYRFLAELAEYAPPGAENWAWAEGELAVKSGTVAAEVFTGSWLQATHEEDPERAVSYRYAPIPTKTPDGDSANTGYVRNITVTTAAEQGGRMDAVKTFLEWITMPENHAEYLTMEPGLFMPPSKAVTDSSAWTEHPLNKEYENLIASQSEAMGRVATIGFSNECSSLNAGSYEGSFTLGAVLQKIVLEDMPVEEAVRWGHEQFEEILASGGGNE